MSMFLVSNRHLGDACPTLSPEVAPFYDARADGAEVRVFCTCPTGEHRMYFFVEADDTAGALAAVPPAFLGVTSTVDPVDRVYEASPS